MGFSLKTQLYSDYYSMHYASCVCVNIQCILFHTQWWECARRQRIWNMNVDLALYRLVSQIPKCPKILDAENEYHRTRKSKIYLLYTAIPGYLNGWILDISLIGPALLTHCSQTWMQCRLKIPQIYRIAQFIKGHRPRPTKHYELNI